MRKIEYIAIHCSATQPNATVESIKKYWKETLKWQTVGYHYIIEADGTIVDLLSIASVSNGVAGFNHCSINICYIGGMNSKGKAADTRTDEQKLSLIKIIREMKTQFPNAIIQGHRDFSTDLNNDGVITPNEWIKLCPCFNAKLEYKFIK